MSNIYHFRFQRFVLLSIFLSSTLGFADAVILMSKGKNELLTNVSDSPNGAPPRVYFEGKHYTLTKARIGKRVKVGDVIKTANVGAVKVAFPSGDSMHIGPASALFIEKGKPSQTDEEKGLTPTLNLIYGKVRAVISKNGPLNNTEIKTRAATAGVRGTDFFVSYNPSANKMFTSVFRGKVEVVQNKKTSTFVEPGYTVQISPEIEKPLAQQSTKQQIQEVHKISNIKISKDDFNKLTKDEQILVKKTEIASRKAILEDIKATNPELAEQIEKRKIKSSQALNAISLSQVYQKAPSDPKLEKPSEKDMQKIIDQDVYEELFNE